MSKIEVNETDKQSGSTLTLGGSGTAVTLATGATQTGFGRTGTVDWQTGSIKTSTFTAANGEGYFADTSSGGFTMNLPAGTAGNIVSVVDYTNTFQTNALTITPNGSQKLGGIAGSAIINTEGQSVTFVYVDDTEGWKNVQDSTSNTTANPYIVASGGTVTECGNCKIHTFTGPGTFTVSATAACAANNVVSHLVLAGGGGTGGGQGTGGGGAGGFREVKSPVNPYTASPLDGYPSAPNRVTVTATAFPIAVGGGGAATPGGGDQGRGTPGSVSTFSTISSQGGGAGGSGGGGASPSGATGGSGGGGGGRCGSAGGSGNTPPVSPPQGGNGGNSTPSGDNPTVDSGGGGGGATANGGSGSANSTGGAGGAGATTNISGSPVTRGGGGGAGSETGGGGAGGSGGGGAGAGGPSASATPGTANTGGGGGGKGADAPSGGNGGSGLVIIRYRFQ